MELSIASAAPSSHWPLSLKRLWLTISEFPFAAFVFLTTSLGLLATLRYFGEIAYPLPDVGSLLAVSGLVTAAAMAVALILAVSLWAPLLILQAVDGVRPRWSHIAWAQIIPATLFLEWAFLAANWDELGAPWNWGIVAYTLIVLAILALWLRLWDRITNKPVHERIKHVWVFFMCILSAAILAQGANLLMQITGGASVPGADQRAFMFLGLFYLAMLLISVLSKIKPGTAFVAVLSAVIVLLVAGSVWTAELPKVLATVAGIRIKSVSDLIISKETCARVQLVAKAQALKLTADWEGKECAVGGALLRAEVQVHSGGRWLLQPLAMDGVDMPVAMGRFTAMDAAVDLVLPTQEKPRR